MSELLTALSVVFIVAGVFVLIANRFDVPSVPALIAAGLVAGLFIDEGLTLELARFGIAFLVFVFGAQLNFSAVQSVLRDGEIVGTVQFLFTGALGFAVGLLVGFDERNALYLGCATALSSTIVGTGLLKTEIRKNLVYGRLAESIHFVQDILAILLILLLSAEAFVIDDIILKIGYGVVILALAYVVNRYVYDQLIRLAEGSQELLLIGSIALLIAFLGLSELVGVSIVVGAFAAGVAVRRDATQNLGMLNGLESIKDFFVAVFFVTLGALVSIPTLDAFLVAGLLIVLTAIIKPIVTTVVLIREGYDPRTAVLTSLSLDQVSEFALIIAIEAFIVGLLVPELFDAIILAAVVTMFTSMFTRRNDERIYRAFANLGLLKAGHAKVDSQSRIPDDITDHVVIVGFGRQGRQLVDECAEMNCPYVVIENDPLLLDALEREADAFVFGDAMESYTWEKANVDDARLVVSTVEQERVSERILGLDTDAEIVLRAPDAKTALSLCDRGALYVNVPDLLAAERLHEHIEAIADDDSGRAARDIREHHLAELAAMERKGFDSLHDGAELLR